MCILTVLCVLLLVGLKLNLNKANINEMEDLTEGIDELKSKEIIFTSEAEDTI